MSHQDSDGRAGHAIARWVAGATVALLATPALPGAAASPHAAVAPRGILAFHSDAGGVSGLYVMNADGSRPLRHDVVRYRTSRRVSYRSSANRLVAGRSATRL